MDVSRFDIIAFPFYGVLMQTLIPLLLLVIAVVKRNRQRKKGSNSS
jgi:spore germination protein KB